MSVAAGKPWWQTTKTGRQGFVLGTWWAILGLVSMDYDILGRDGSWEWAVSAGWLAAALGYFVTAIALRRRERSGSGADSQGPPGLPPSS